MLLKDVLTLSRRNYKQNGYISHFLFVFLALLASAFIVVGVFFMDIIFLIVPFIVIPTLFATQLIIILMREQPTLTFMGFLRSFGAYFSNKFNSTFGVLKSLLISFLIYVGFSFIYGLTINLSFYYTNYMGYFNIINEIINKVTLDPAAINELINTYRLFFSYLMVWTSLPPLFVLSIVFIFFTSRHSISLFFRLQTPKMPGKMNLFIHREVMRKQRKEFNRLYFALNWPLFVLFIGGFVGGAFIGYYSFQKYMNSIELYSAMYSLSLALGVFASYGIYGPFYLANKEAIYYALGNAYKEETNILEQNMGKVLDEMMNKYLQKNNEEDTKKDSDES